MSNFVPNAGPPFAAALAPALRRSSCSFSRVYVPVIAHKVFFRVTASAHLAACIQDAVSARRSSLHRGFWCALRRGPRPRRKCSRCMWCFSCCSNCELQLQSSNGSSIWFGDHQRKNHPRIWQLFAVVLGGVASRAGQRAVLIDKVLAGRGSLCSQQTCT
jgi:hypothetical protein